MLQGQLAVIGGPSTIIPALVNVQAKSHSTLQRCLQQRVPSGNVEVQGLWMSLDWLAHPQAVDKPVRIGNWKALGAEADTLRQWAASDDNVCAQLLGLEAENITVTV